MEATSDEVYTSLFAFVHRPKHRQANVFRLKEFNEDELSQMQWRRELVIEFRTIEHRQLNEDSSQSNRERREQGELDL